MNPPALPPQPPSYQMMEDASHLRMLAIGFYVYAGLTAFFSLFALLYMGIGGAIMTGKMFPKGSTPPPGAPFPEQWMGGFFFGFGLVFFLLIIGMAVLSFLTARWVLARRYPVFCMVIGALCCLNMPLGTILGVFTFIVLLRPSVQELFRAGPERNNFVHH
ncbi:MAG: hypothetical protein EOP87_12160 [Verrucomicrobiaceae bacterium]|nr:MAG: hypothetical protein EOP87_12160 [Verrucomicrobiaceae bacterium]